MRLTKLEVHGFKAFADHLEFVFERGVTAIVGPNGSGKSNVSDAVRWVLGEQRARAMRGAKMEDVIFHGSSARKPVNMAEVSLHFDNTEGELPIPFKEVVITRRLLRSGESEYLLNRAPCRLRDIQDLVRGTGLGADSGVVIESKMIDALLSDRPDDRRELFEEAAGVGLYRDRRRSAERRLEETTVDLARLDDLIAEVQSQVRSLARQRRRAERHAELTARRFQVEISLATREMAAWRDELEALDGRLTELRGDVPGAEEAIAAAELQREEAHMARSTAEASRLELARLAAEQREKTQKLERELAVSEERQRSTTMRRQRAEEERKENEAFGRRLREDRERAATDRTTLEQEVRDAGEALQERLAAEQTAREGVQRERSVLDQLERQVREHRDQARRLELDRDGASREQMETEQRRDALDLERQTLVDTLEAIERELLTAREQVSISQAAAQDALDALEGARLAAATARTADAESRSALASAVEVRTQLEGRMNALAALERERVGLAPSSARLLKERARFGDGAILGPLTDFVTADGEAARLVERYLGATMHAIVVRDAEAAAAVRRWHTETQPGPLLLLPLDVVTELGADAGTESGALAGSVQASGPTSRWVRALLGKVRALDSGEAFVDEHGAVFLPGTATGPGPLQRRAELNRLESDLAAADARREEAALTAEAARLALGEAERAQQAATEGHNRAQQEARRATEVRQEVERRRERAERELAQSNTLAERLVTRLQELEQRMQQLAQQAEALHARAGEADSDIDQAREALAVAEREQEQAREARATWQVAQAQAQARLSVAIDREKRLSEEDSTAAARLESLARELSTLSDADQHLAQQLDAWRAELDTERKTLADADGRLAEAERAVAAANAALDTCETALDEARRRSSALGEQLHGAQLRHTELSGRREAIRQRLETEWRRSLDDLLAGFEELDVPTDDLRVEATQLRTSLDELGPVNPLAIEEHEEEQRRLEFLTAQRNDLVAAKQSLHQAIREIDSTARELFLATFAQVRENFRQIFLRMFGGGECDLRLENPDAPLDCDIEIHASPRGKKTQRIHLLSSGERALVALSLLFGIFLTKPSPFCLMDEVDAPLDDQNIGRFVKMLNDFKSRTQFIVITHNPRTTSEAADAVYGVTMQEPGVSSIVSVRLRNGPAVDESAGRVDPADDQVDDPIADPVDDQVGDPSDAEPSPA
ncbi:chromosome segregation protein SMC [Gemmatimonas aurantiaca]|uniref:chromosome segregation protein SMC n=1 Tax=Gemmatimonas aurantiaca TaxID=173480 RepID=UPI00301D710B